MAALCGSCAVPDVVECGTLICPAGYVCAATGDACYRPEQIDACAGLDDGSPCAFGAASGTCDRGICIGEDCGDGEVTGAEDCDGDVSGATCLELGFYEPGGLACSSSCRYDTTACVGFCGDDTINGPEACDEYLKCLDKAQRGGGS